MKKLRIGIIDIVSRGPTRALYARVMNANLASIMPQVIGVWCRQDGHDVTFVCYTGLEDLSKELPDDVDLVFIGAFTEAAHTAYALSNLFRSQGRRHRDRRAARPLLPGRRRPALRLRPGVHRTGRRLREVLQDCSQHRPVGVQVAAGQQPRSLPGVRERWPFIEPTLRKAPLIKMVPMLGSLGCPYTCSFCIDAAVPYQAMDFAVLREDLRFLLEKYKRPMVAFHDPNFGVRFDDILDAIEEAVPPGRIDFAAESSLSLLSEPHLKRLQRNGFKALLPGIESWFDLGNKSKTGALQGIDKVRQVSEHVNLILKYVPYVQTNFVLGLDSDAGRRTLRTYPEVPGPDSGRLSGILPADRLWPGRAPQPRIPACRPGAAVPLPLPEQQPRHERQAQELRLAGLLRPRRRPDALFLFLARDWASFPCHRRHDCAVDEPGAGGFDRRVWKAQVPYGNSPAAGQRPAIPALL